MVCSIDLPRVFNVSTSKNLSKMGLRRMRSRMHRNDINCEAPKNHKSLPNSLVSLHDSSIAWGSQADHPGPYLTTRRVLFSELDQFHFLLANATDHWLAPSAGDSSPIDDDLSFDVGADRGS